MLPEEEFFRNIYSDLLLHGNTVCPRGLEIIEIENFRLVVNPYARFVNFSSRKLNLNYIKQEFLWYLKGDRFDTSISKYAKLWVDIINLDGSINSNYGQYIFNQECGQFFNVVKILTQDTASRRASMVILQPWHLLSDTRDIPCTYALNFHIRNDKLNMTVHMRSQDAIYGFASDLPTFSFIHEMLYVYLRDTVYPALELGTYTHLVDSFHVYKQHYHIARSIAFNSSDIFTNIDCPRISSVAEVLSLVENNYRLDKQFTSWLLATAGGLNV